MKITVPSEIREWSFWLSSGLLGEEKLPLCPWAKKSMLDGSVDFWEDDVPLDLIPLPEKIRVRLVHLPGIPLEDLVSLRNSCNLGQGEFVFLESHPDDPGLIGGIKSVSDLPLIVIQRRSELLEAREILRKGNYYGYWDLDILQEMMNI